MTMSTPGALTVAYQRRVEAAWVPYGRRLSRRSRRDRRPGTNVVTLLAAVAGGGDDDGALCEGVLDGGFLGGLGVGGLAVVAEGEVDDVGALVGGPADAFGEGVAAGVAGLPRAGRSSRITRTGRIFASGAMPMTPSSLPGPWP